MTKKGMNRYESLHLSRNLAKEDFDDEMAFEFSPDEKQDYDDCEEPNED